VGTTHQSGEQISQSEGVNVKIGFRNGAPSWAEVYSDDQEEYAELGLVFHGNELSDFDGASALPSQVADLLAEVGFVVGEDFRHAPATKMKI
jgi:hypothetical protein